MSVKNKLSLLLLLLHTVLNAQDSASTSINYASPKEYEIGGITGSGSDRIDQNVLMLLSGLKIGDKIQVPGDKLSTAIENLWKQGLFEDIKITADKIVGDVIYINIAVAERPKLNKYTITGVKKGELEDIEEKLPNIKGRVITDALRASIVETIKTFLKDKGYLDVKVETQVEKDPKNESNAILAIKVVKGNKIKIQDINLIGVNAFKPGKVRRTFKETKQKRWWNPFNSGKLNENDLEKDEKLLIEKYNSKGYRDAKIVRDSVYRVSPKRISIDVEVKEGHVYYFRNITWIGNSKYSSKTLSNVLAINKGDVYDQSKLNTKLYMNPNGNDVSSLYMDEGYLFFNITPVEIMATEDSIDLEMRIYEGKQATVNKIIIKGNTKTNEHVIRREIRTQPGQLFRRSDVIRTQRELSQLGYFDPEKMGVNPIPNPANSTVDIEYTVEEKPSDQVQLSGGYGNKRLVGTLGVSFTNFSARSFFKKESWRPLPSGDGQRLSIQAQSTGRFYQAFNIAFVEPWLGGAKPTSLSLSTNYTRMVDASIAETNFLNITGASVGIGKRLKVPDDYFTLFQELNYDYYVLKNYSRVFSFSNGYSNNIYYKITLQRNSIDKPIFETRGSQISLSGQFTPPYSAFNNVDYSNPAITDQDRYKFVEYQKYKFSIKHFTPITNKKGKEGKDARNLILKTQAGFGFLSPYSSKTGDVPFERFYLGGSGLTGFRIGGQEVIALRGYDDYGSVSPKNGAAYIAKYSMELRFPIVLSQQATIFTLAFLDAGNSWDKAREFNPFDLKRSTGFGVRLFLPMFGLLGFDYGWRLDDSNYGAGQFMQKGQFHFTIGATLGEL